MLKVFPKILAWSSLIIWLSFIYLFLQYDATRPTTPQPAEGRLYSSNNHGHVTYLTKQEEDYLDSLQVGAFSLFALAALMDYFQRKPQKIRETRLIAMQTLYGVFEPASWFAFGAKLRRQVSTISIPSIVGVLVSQKRLSLHSQETISDCRTRLIGSIGFNTVGPVLGDISGDKFLLYVTRRDFRNSFGPHFHGKLVAAPSGTVIEGKFRMHFIVRIFLSIWFTGVIAIGGKMALLSFKGIAMAQPTSETYVGLFFPVALFLCGLLMVYWGKTLGTDDEVEIMKFLQNTLHSRP